MKKPSIRFFRRLAQFGCAAAFVVIPFLNLREMNALSGNFLAFNFAGLPFEDPLAALQVLLSAFSPTSSMLLGAALVLLIALVLGPVFCSWICPYGFLSELVHSGAKAHAANSQALADRGFFTSLYSGDKAETYAAGAGKRGAAMLSLRPFWTKVTIACIGLFLTATLVPFPLLNQLSLPGWYSRIMQHIALQHGQLWGGLGLILLAIAVEKLSGKRFWCRYVCPQSILIAVTGLLLPRRLQVAFTRKACNCPASDRSCGKACSLNLDPRLPENVAQRLQCTNCGDCVDACRLRGKALALRFDR